MITLQNNNDIIHLGSKDSIEPQLYNSDGGFFYSSKNHWFWAFEKIRIKELMVLSSSNPLKNY